MEGESYEFLRVLNQNLGTWDQNLGLRIVVATRDEVVAEYTASAKHHQPYGIVHGGVHCSVVETVCSMGAGLAAREQGRGVVGIENHTSFVHAVRSGKITVRAVPLTRGRRSQLWEAIARDETGRIVSTGRVRLLCLEDGAALAGEPLKTRPEREPQS